MADSQPTQNLFSAASLCNDCASLRGNVSQVTGYSIQAIWKDGVNVNGTLKLQVCNTDSNWEDLPGSNIDMTSESGSQIYNVSPCFYNYVRLVYTGTADAGTIDAILVSKS